MDLKRKDNTQKSIDLVISDFVSTNVLLTSSSRSKRNGNHKW